LAATRQIENSGGCAHYSCWRTPNNRDRRSPNLAAQAPERVAIQLPEAEVWLLTQMLKRVFKIRLLVFNKEQFCDNKAHNNVCDYKFQHLKAVWFRKTTG